MAYSLDGIPFDTLTSPKEGVRRFKATSRSELTDAVRFGDAGVVSCDIEAEAGETVAINVNFDVATVVSKVEAIGDYDITVRACESTGTYGAVCLGHSQNLLIEPEYFAQAQVVQNAVSTGNILADGSVSDSIITDGTQPITVIITNRGSAATIPIFVTFYAIDTVSTVNPLEANSSLASDTEMSDYA